MNYSNQSDPGFTAMRLRFMPVCDAQLFLGDQTQRIYTESFWSEDSFPGDLHRTVLVSTAILFAILRRALLGVPGGADFTQIDSLADIANFHYQNIPLQDRADTFND